MPRPEQKLITFTVNGREVEAVENTMLVDAAKQGDVEIPVFCYEPKLGQPVGACRMCLVEVEGIPKLQTACSTPVKAGMVVNTESERVKEAQRSVVEFLLVNHPLDCPVCDKGGECPLQDITFGYGPGISRFVEPKRHFEKPIELSPLVAIDRERCILCYRCVRFSQEVSEDYQLVLQERGSDSYVATFDGHPYEAPFSGNIIELCPVGALTSTSYRFRARPWDIEQSGTVCTLCPSQCNVSLTVRDENVVRVLARDNDQVDDGWLCDKGRFSYQSIRSEQRITEPMIRDGGKLRPVTWEQALATAANGLSKANGAVGALIGGEATNEEAYLLQRILREQLNSNSIDSRNNSQLPRQLTAALDAPALQATVTDVEFANTVLLIGTDPVDDMPILDLRIRKALRRRVANLAIANPRPTTLDANASAVVRYAPNAEAAFLQALAAALSNSADAERLAEAAGSQPSAIRQLVDLFNDDSQDSVVIYGERVISGSNGSLAAQLILEMARSGAQLNLEGREGSGLIQIPSGSNGRGLRELGSLPDSAAGYQALTDDPPGLYAQQQAEALADGQQAAIYLLQVDPAREYPDTKLWQRALSRATTVITHASFLTEAVSEYATVVFPAQAYAEKEGTVTHPDGRIQRLRPAIGNRGSVQHGWQLLAELSRRLGSDSEYQTNAQVTTELSQRVGFYSGLDLDQIAGRGQRWQEQSGATNFPDTTAPQETVNLSQQLTAVAAGDGKLRLGSYRPIWSSIEIEHSPSLSFLTPQQRIELSPSDAAALGIKHLDQVRIVADQEAVSGQVFIRDAIPTGSVFIAEATSTDNGNLLVNGEQRVVEVQTL